MPDTSLLINLLAGIGLAVGSGLNPWIPVLGVCIAARTDVIALASGMEWMGSNWAIGAAAALLILDFIGDKVPAIDSAVHVVGLVVHPVVGATVLGAQANLLSDVNPALGWAAGAALGGGVHAARSAIRPVVTATSAGVGNPIVSLIEDIVSFIMTLLAVVIPILGFVLACLLVFGITRRVLKRRAAGSGSGGGSGGGAGGGSSGGQRLPARSG